MNCQYKVASLLSITRITALSDKAPYYVVVCGIGKQP